MDKEKIGIFISELRKEKGWTQAQLAEKLFVDRTTVSKWERGLYIPDLEALKEIENLFGVSINEIVSAERLVQCTKLKDNEFYDRKKLKYVKKVVFFVTILAFIILVFLLYLVWYRNNVLLNDTYDVPQYIKDNFNYNYDDGKFYNERNDKKSEIYEEYFVDLNLFIVTKESQNLIEHYEYDFEDNFFTYYEIIANNEMDNFFYYNIADNICERGTCNLEKIYDFFEKYNFFEKN